MRLPGQPEMLFHFQAIVRCVHHSITTRIAQLNILGFLDCLNYLSSQWYGLI
jgi:hypothetical protein